MARPVVALPNEERELDWLTFAHTARECRFSAPCRWVSNTDATLRTNGRIVSGTVISVPWTVTSPSAARSVSCASRERNPCGRRHVIRKVDGEIAHQAFDNAAANPIVVRQGEATRGREPATLDRFG